MERRKRIGFLTSKDALNRRSWSGTLYFMSAALQRNVGEVVHLGPLESRWAVVGKLLNKLSLYLLGKQYDYIRARWYARRVSSAAYRSLKAQALDYVIVPANAPAISYLKPAGVPLCFVSDTTFALVIDYYKSFSGYLPISIRDGHRVAKYAMERADSVSFSSRWAADSATRDYGISPEKVHVVPFGANIDSIPAPAIALNRRRSRHCRLLFLGVDWTRKGGDIAFETLLCLEADYGIMAHLTVCGCKVPNGLAHERMTNLDFLDKRDPDQAAVLSRLFEESDYLLLPTRSECYGVVFCEASAYGLPSISTNTGGVSGVIKEGKNGFLLPAEAGGDKYAAKIAEIESDDELYASLCRSSRSEFESRLNWDSWAERIDSIMSVKV